MSRVTDIIDLINHLGPNGLKKLSALLPSELTNDHYQRGYTDGYEYAEHYLKTHTDRLPKVRETPTPQDDQGGQEQPEARRPRRGEDVAGDETIPVDAGRTCNVS